MMEEVYLYICGDKHLEIQERFGIHPGKSYRVNIGPYAHDGILRSANIKLRQLGQTFELERIHLVNGVIIDRRDPSIRVPFDELMLRANELDRSTIQKIRDADGLQRVRRKTIEDEL